MAIPLVSLCTYLPRPQSIDIWEEKIYMSVCWATGNLEMF